MKQFEFKGTQGEWELIIPKHNESNGFATVSTNYGSITCYNGITGDKEGGAHQKSLANALLISKAPEMFEMLKECLTYFELQNYDVQNTQKIKEIKKLLKEATQL